MRNETNASRTIFLNYVYKQRMQLMEKILIIKSKKQFIEMSSFCIAHTGTIFHIEF